MKTLFSPGGTAKKVEEGGEEDVRHLTKELLDLKTRCVHRFRGLGGRVCCGPEMPPPTVLREIRSVCFSGAAASRSRGFAKNTKTRVICVKYCRRRDAPGRRGTG